MKVFFQFSLILFAFQIIGCTEKEQVKVNKRNPESSSVNYVGESACIECHKTAYDDWVGSHHDWSMKLPTRETVLGDFDNVTFEADSESYFFYQKGEGYYIDYTTSEGSKKNYKVAYTFGVTPLQQYLIKFPDGKYQTLRATWDVQEKRWYNQYKDQHIPDTDWLHWTRGGQNWNTMCAECHSTNLHKNYDQSKNEFSTTYSIINVSCESCHGPGKEHVKWASKENPTGNPRIEAGGVGQYAQMNMCAGCHARRTKLTEVMTPTKKFDDQFGLQTINVDYYFPDGQIKEEDYVFGSFTQSKMFHNQVKCSDCHNIHSLKLKAQGNALCLQCHVPTYNSPSHHFHEAGTESAQCVSCHMTGRNYMGIDFRRDHSFRVPRPDQRVKYGTPNACNECHKDKSNQWAADWVVKWYGSKRADHFSDHLLLASNPPYSDQVKEDVIKFINNLNYPAIARATALEYYPSFSSEDELKMLIEAFKDSSALVRYHAVNKLQQFPLEQRADIALNMMSDTTKLVRTAAAWLMVEVDPTQVSQEVQESFYKASVELLHSLHANADFPLGRLRLGDYYFRKNNFPKAIKEYKMALKLDSLLTPVYSNLATVYNRMGDNSKALSTLNTLTQIEPTYARAYYLRALLYYEMNNAGKAEIDFKKAISYDLNEFRYYYNLANLYLKQSKYEEALSIIQQGLNVSPESPEGLALEQQIISMRSGMR